MSLLKTLTRILAIVGKELVSVLRRPGALISLVLGPFLIMALFGVGYSGYRRPLDTILVIPAGTGLSTDAKPYQDVAGEGLHIVAVTPDETAAMAKLDDPAGRRRRRRAGRRPAQFEAGQRTQISVRVNLADPVQGSYAVFLTRGRWRPRSTARSSSRRAARARARRSSQGAADAGKIPPDVVAAPTEAVLDNVAPSQPTVVQYFGPAVLALILQHLAITLIALSVVRETHERPVRAVPDLADHHVRARHRQAHRLRDLRRGGRPASPSPSS